MAALRVTGDDIERLAAKLDGLGQSLAETERAFLAAVFRLAGDALAEERREAELTPFGLGAIEELLLETEGFDGSLSASFRGAFSVGLSARLPRIPGKAPGIEGTDVSTGS